MPYDANDVESLPKNVQGLDEHHRKMWSDVWNSAYEQHGDESKAYAIANGVLKKRLEHSTSEESNESTPKGIDGGDITGISDLELPIYDPADPRSLEEAIFKEVGLTVVVKTKGLYGRGFNVLTIKMSKGDGAASLVKFLNFLKDCGQIGHSVSWKITDPVDEKEKNLVWGFDGDGSDAIEEIKLTEAEAIREAN